MNYTLLADDDEDFGSLLEAAFEIAGIAGALRRVRDGVRAQRYLRGEGRYVDRITFPFPTLVLLDLNLPRPDGWELLRWIRSQTRLAELRVVILSGMDLNGKNRRALEMGADACWEKPFPFSGLVNMVENFRDRWLAEEPQMLRAA